MNESNGYDIVIAGAGPAGAISAGFATKYGARVLLVERSLQRLNPVRCAEGLFLKGLSPDIKIPGEFVSSRLNSLVIHAPDGSNVLFPDLGKGLILHRHLYEDYLVSKAQTRGVDFYPSASVTDVNLENGILKSVLVATHGKSIPVSCKILIAADGVESLLARKVGLDTVLDPKDLESGYQFRIKHPDILADAIHIYTGSEFAPGSYAWVFPKTDGIANVGLAIGAGMSVQKSARDYCRDFLKKTFPNAEIIGESGGGIPIARNLDQLSRQGFMVVGDAARLVNPLTGGGIDSALISGRLAGLIASEAIARNDCSAAFLQSYDRQIKRQLGVIDQVMYFLARKAKSISDARFNSIIGYFNQIPLEQRTVKKFFMYALRKHPEMLLRLSKTYLLGA